MTEYSPNTTWVSAWINRMAEAHGGTVSVHPDFDASDVVRSFGYDWGQALCREQYGADPSTWPADPADDDIARARRWENGDWPEWAIRPEDD